MSDASNEQNESYSSGVRQIPGISLRLIKNTAVDISGWVDSIAWREVPLDDKTRELIMLNLNSTVELFREALQSRETPI